MQDGYSICLNRWALDKDIKNELGLLLIISSLCAEKGYCFASNNYLAKEFKITEISISMKIKKLQQKNYITIEYEKRGCEIISRKIRLKNILIDDLKNFKSTIKENFKDNNTSINNTSINNKDKKNFIKPTLEEIEQYCKERNNNVNSQQFYDFYESKGWMVGKNKMKDWKACIRTWEQRSNKKQNIPQWINQKQEKSITTKAEQEELKELLKEFK